MDEDHVLDGAAVLAFFFLLAVFPAAIFLFSLLPSLSIPHLEQAIFDLIRQVLPEQSANFFQGTFRYVSSEGKGKLLIFGLIFSAWSGSVGVYALIQQLNIIADIVDRRPFWKVRGIAILLMVFFAALAIGSLSTVIYAGVIQSWVASMIGWSQPLRIFFATLRWIILAAALLLALAVGYRIAPAKEVRFRYLAPGSVVAAVLIALSSVGFRIYVSRFGNYSATYGSLAAIIVLMMWMYLAGIAVLLGAEVDKILSPRK